MATYSTDKPYHRKVRVVDLAMGTDGQVITYDANGAPTAVGPGTTGQVLTSAGAGAPQAFATPTVFNDNNLKEDIAIVAFKSAAVGSFGKYNLVDQTIDSFQNTSGIFASLSSNYTHDNTNKLYHGNESDMVLVSTATTAEAVPTKGDLIIVASEASAVIALGNGLNGDLRAWITRDNGTSNLYWTQVTLVKEGVVSGDQAIYSAHDVDISSLPAEAGMRWKITTHNQSASNITKIHDVSLGWS